MVIITEAGRHGDETCHVLQLILPSSPSKRTEVNVVSWVGFMVSRGAVLMVKLKHFVVVPTESM